MLFRTRRNKKNVPRNLRRHALNLAITSSVMKSWQKSNRRMNRRYIAFVTFDHSESCTSSVDNNTERTKLTAGIVSMTVSLRVHVKKRNPTEEDNDTLKGKDNR